MRLDAVLEFQPRQVARQQEIALDRPDIDRPLGGDPGRVVGEKIPIGRELRRPFHRLDIAFHHLDGDHGAVGIEFLHRHNGARKYISVAAIFGSDALGEVVHRLQRHRFAEEVGVELGQLSGGVDGGAEDANLPDDELGLGGPGRRLDAGHRDGGPARLRQRRGEALEALAFAAGLVAGRHDLCTWRDDLCDGGE